jgi:hypothetical protein
VTQETLTQCELRRGDQHQTLWLPTKYAKTGQRIGLREKTSQGGAYWDEGWTIEQVFTTMPQDYVLERSQDYKKTRNASDI